MSRIESVDVVVELNVDGIFDIQMDDEGDVLSIDALDTSLRRSIYGERRATKEEVPVPQLRRGWIGNEGKDFEDGSKVWLYEQSRLNSETLNGVRSEIKNGLLWLLEDKVALEYQVNVVIADEMRITADIKIKRSSDAVDNFYFNLFENTGDRG